MPRLVSDFGKYEALVMFEMFQNTTYDNKYQMESFYNVAYLPKDQYRSLHLRLIRDKDH